MIISVLDMTLYGKDIGGKIRIKYFETTDENGNNVFIISILGTMLILLACIVDGYFCNVAMHYRDNLKLELANARNAKLQ